MNRENGVNIFFQLNVKPLKHAFSEHANFAQFVVCTILGLLILAACKSNLGDLNLGNTGSSAKQ